KKIADCLTVPAPCFYFVFGNRGVENVPASIGVGESPAVIEEQHDPTVFQTDQTGGSFGGDDRAWLGSRPCSAVIARERLVETAHLRPNQHPDPAILQLNDHGLNPSDRAQVRRGYFQRGRGLTPRFSIVIRIEDTRIVRAHVSESVEPGPTVRPGPRCEVRNRQQDSTAAELNY